MTSLDWNPDTKKLRQFGIAALLGFGLIGLAVAHHLGCFDGSGRWLASQILWSVGALSLLLGLLRPALLKPMFVVLSIITFPIGLVVSNVLLFLIYACLIVPTGAILKLLGRDPLQRKFDRPQSSYWTQRKAAVPVERYFHQY